MTTEARTGFRITLHQRITVLAMAITLPYLGHALWTAEHERKQAVAQSGEHLLTISRRLAADFAHGIDQTQRLLALFTTTVNAHQPLETSCEPTLRSMVEKFPIFLQAMVARPDGRVVCGVNPVPPESNIADRDYFKRAFVTRDFATSGLVVSRTTGEHALAAGYPILDGNGNVRGVTAVSVGLGWLQTLFRDVQLPQNAVASIVDREGRVVVRHPPPEGAIGLPVPDIETFLTVVRKREETLATLHGGDELSRLVAVVRVLGDISNPVYVRVDMPRDLIEADAHRTLISGLATFALVALMGSALAWFAGRNLVVRPVRHLGEVVQRMGITDLGVRTGLADDRTELGRLAASFDAMADRLQRSVRALRALSAGSHTIIRQQTEQELIERMCKVAFEEGGYPLAMVHYAVDDGRKSLVARAHAGGPDDYIAQFDLNWGDNKRGRGPAGVAVRTGYHDIVRDIASETRFSPWREMALRAGFGSVISFPLRVEGRVIGVYTLLAAEPDAFDRDELNLLEEMAADLAFGIEAIRAREQRDRAQAAAEHAATHDAVTGLPNRMALENHLARLLESARPTGESTVVLVAYLPNLKELFDALGHEPSNAIVAMLAGRLRAVDNFGGFVARTSFDEFCIALASRSVDEAIPFAHVLQRKFLEPVSIGDASIEVRAAIGIAVCPNHGNEPDLLLRRAGLAAHEGTRRDLTHFVYRGATDRENPQRLAMVAELRRAIDQHELRLHYQPKIDIRSGRMVSVEALVRWMHPEKGMVSPAQFIPLAEQTGLIRPMTYAILELAAHQQAEWASRGLQTPIAVNLAARSIADAQFIPLLADTLARAGVPASLVEVEITESSLVEDPEGARQMLAVLSETGCRIYLDDFGTGYSCLNYLVHLPVHALKIDRSFITQMSKSKDAYLVVASVISMAQGLGLKVVAEGVETEGDLALLREMGCDEGQGYYFCKPLPAAELEALWASGKLAHAV